MRKDSDAPRVQPSPFVHNRGQFHGSEPGRVPKSSLQPLAHAAGWPSLLRDTRQLVQGRGTGEERARRTDEIAATGR